jgi:hypothetical protein
MTEVKIEIETAIRRMSFWTAQVGQKSLHTLLVDFDKKQITSSYSTGITHVLGVPLKSTRDKFEVSSVRFRDSLASCRALGQTASGVKFMPDIDYDLYISLAIKPRIIAITGSHDGYPSYNVSVNGKSVYDFVQQDISQLRGPMDQQVMIKSASW